MPENNLPAFITVDMLFSQEIGQSRRVFDGKTEHITTSLQTTVSISCYGNHSIAMATKLKNLLQSSAALSAFKAMNAGIVRFSDVRNLTTTVGADYEERGQFDCVISHHHIVAIPLEPILQVEHHTNQSIQQTIKGAI